MSKIEKETIINWNEAEADALIYSCSYSIWKKCEEMGLQSPSQGCGASSRQGGNRGAGREDGTRKS